jgi:hypothetical protein
MDQLIIYQNKGTTNGVVLLVPALDCGLTIQQIAAKDVPSGVPYIIINRTDLPTGSDAMFIEAWEADFSTPTGVGANHGIGSYYAVTGYNSDGTPILRQESVIQ